MNRRHDISSIRKLAKSRGGKCLSSEYFNTYSKLQWECEIGHQWEASPAAVLGSRNQLGSWCPTCNQKGKREQLCRILLEEIFKKRFPKTRPSWLKGLKGISLELDGYNSELALAFEFQGPHHNHHIPYFHDSKRRLGIRLSDQKKRDSIKRRKCKENRVRLIEISYSYSRKSIQELGDFLLDECRNFKFKVPQKIDFSSVDLATLWTPHSLRQFDLAKELATKNEGRVLSKHYLGANFPLLWKCKVGHEWEASLGHIKRGSWCKNCHFEGRKRSLEDAQAVASQKSGVCLSRKYVDSNSKLKWRCEYGHTWVASFQKINSGRWCPTCAKSKRGSSQRRSISELQLLAKNRGGQCLSQTYSNVFTKYEFECERKHKWKATAKIIRSGSWCPICIGKNKSIDAAIKLAQSRNGTCLSKRYTNNRTKLKWQCAVGHIWFADFSNTNSGKWCPKCAIVIRGNSLRGNIKEMRELAKSRGGVCLSTSYINANSHLKWQCSEGHQWKATPGHIKDGTWCLKCHRSKKIK